MRPIRLQMTAFGPFAGRIDIPFHELGASGLYLITGPTGAGKTTIFDAISFALFGAPSSSRLDGGRTNAMLRSSYALPEVSTVVELDFVHEGRQYHIERDPGDYWRAPLKKKESGALVRAQPTALLTGPEGQTLADRPGTVTAQVQQLLGVDQEQFAQISMIAQGAFQEVLLEKTKKRSEIFSKVFNTGRFNQLQERLGEKEREQKALFDETLSAAQYEVNSIQWQGEAPEGAAPSEHTLEQLDVQNKQDAAREKALEKQSGVLQEQLAELDRRRTEAKELTNKFRALEEARKSAVLLQEAIVQKKAALQAAEARKPEADGLARQLSVTESRQPEYAAVAEQKQQLAQLEQRLEQEKASCARGDAAVALSRQKLEELRTRLEQLKKDCEALPQLRADAQKTAGERQALEALQTALTEYEKQLAQMERQAQTYRAAAAVLLAAQEEHRHKKAAYLKGQAGILAASLVPGAACPVCGATEHPAPAVASADAPTKAQLDALEQKEEADRKKERAAFAEASAHRAALDAKESHLRTALKAQLGIEDIAAAARQLTSVLTEKSRTAAQLNGSIAALEAKEKTVKGIAEDIPAQEQTLKKQEEALQALERDTAAHAAALQAGKQHLAERAAQLEYPDWSAAEAAIKQKRAAAKAIAEALETAEKALMNALRQEAGLSSTLQLLQAQLQGRQLPDAQQLTAQWEEKQREIACADGERKSLYSRLDRNTGIALRLKRLLAQLQEQGEKLAWLHTLSATANGGHLPGKSNRIKLETFVQMTFFDQILIRANTRLRRMTDDQYELRRRTEGGDGRSEDGLELEVYDYHSCKARDVKSLSGGEKFKASLALALGLSDEIQASSKMQIDTMFVDEGFGTLDAESLQQALQTLSELGGAHRLVGIISHVESLKQKIDRQIVVDKKPGGESAVSVQV